jgi:Tir chaperone protein (CesT) family
MRTEKDVEAYLLRLNRRFRALEERPGTFLVEVGEKAPPLVVRVEPPLVVVRVQLGEVPSPGDAALLRKLLELNAKQLLHASYGIDDGRVVLSSALELENLDFNELQATMDEIDMALAQPIPGIAPKN